MKKKILDSYEYEKGIPLREVETYECPQCLNFIFTAKQVDEMEERTLALKIHRFSFKRKLTVSGRSLVINLPEDLVRHASLKKGMTIHLTPLDDRLFLVETGR